ncbi:MAG: 5-(carboxyamino)imidazole ribonucleotide mutase [Spartobacteria bacterium]|nr:5-(carboxyamino)imidazole ribonucleotide mutase [Spartobacteria bacterium]
MAKKAKTPVAVVMGSASDWPVVKHAVDTLEQFSIACDVRVMSAHRTPDEAAEFSKTAEREGIKVIIASAGMAAHLAGVLAAHTILPVIGVPMKGGAMDGLDALLSTVQMPSGVPVATVALGRAGANNAALLAVQILALGDASLRRRLKRHKENMKKAVQQANQSIQDERSA